MEAIGSLSSTKDGLYLAGGALSGNAYLWEVSKNSIKLPCSIDLCNKAFSFLLMRSQESQFHMLNFFP